MFAVGYLQDGNELVFESLDATAMAGRPYSFAVSSFDKGQTAHLHTRIKWPFVSETADDEIEQQRFHALVLLGEMPACGVPEAYRSILQIKTYCESLPKSREISGLLMTHSQRAKSNSVADVPAITFD